MTKQDKKDIIHLFNEGFEQVVLPHIVEMKEELSGVKGDVSTIKNDVDTLKSDVRDIKETIGRIERRQEAEQIMLDNHDVLLTRLEKAVLAK